MQVDPSDIEMLLSHKNQLITQMVVANQENLQQQQQPNGFGGQSSAAAFGPFTLAGTYSAEVSWPNKGPVILDQMSRIVLIKSVSNNVWFDAYDANKLM